MSENKEHKLFSKKQGPGLIYFAPLVLLLLLLLFITSCGSYIPDYDSINYFEGIDGLEMEFLDQNPPDEIYEDSAFNVNLYVENKGAFDVIGESYGILSIGFDPFYIETTGLQSSANIEVDESSVILKGLQLPGKSKYHPAGSETFVSIPNFRTKTIKGQREQPDTQLFASLCYPYITHFANLVCVDLNLVGPNLREQVCHQEDFNLEDQGAPVAITLIEVENQPAGAGPDGNPAIRPVFTVHVKNRGSGHVLSPAYNAVELDRVCSFDDLNRDDFNTIEVTALLSNSRYMECNPNPIKLFGGEGFTRCQVRDPDLILGHQNYQTILQVNLSYVYLTSVSKDIEIKRINPYGGPREAPETCPSPWIEHQGKCIEKCTYCAKYNPTDGRCQPSAGGYPHIEFNAGWACQCTGDECRKKRTKEECLLLAGYCPGANYCCIKDCSSSEVLIGDKCYDKCSECDRDGEEEDCACGEEEIGYVVVAQGSYCCPDTKQGHSSYDSCDMACNPDDYEENLS